ncbi:sulfotransferase family 2 domain-containing protein [Synechococcus sp. CC9616]|uniref:sulfotransferase family 2 domain-containing protein n=1 Tax=Synechococcus sp. CC9616 TaxID=110663 RepID=UPI00048BFA37|nr:sulfotransferase family 2 domain-containing protein [Synechococcus sp. CC9616]
MIFSELHNFLFLKGRKVASTSFEVALSKICGADDIITPITPVDERYRIDLGYRHAQNFGADTEKLDAYIKAVKKAEPGQFEQIKKPKGTIQDHCTLREAWDFFGERLRSKRIIAIARNPYQSILSRLNHMARFDDYKKSGDVICASQEQLQNELNVFIKKLINESYPKNIAHYTAPSQTSIPLEVTYLKFEHLQSELDQLLADLNISDKVSLPHLKKGQNLPNEAILDVADADQLRIINDYFDDEFKAFGYQKLEASPA